MNLALGSEILFWAGSRRPRMVQAIIGLTPPSVMRAIRRSGFKKTLRAAGRLPFYQEAFSRAGIDIRSVSRPEDMGDFYLSSEVLKREPERLVCGSPELAIESSGTSGHISRVYLSRRELEYNARQGVLTCALWGLGPQDRLLSTFDLGFGLGSLLVERWVQNLPLFSMVVGRVDPLDAYQRLAEYRFNVIASDPFWLARLTEIASVRGRPGPLKLMIGGGEGVTAQLRSELERFWEAPLHMTYGSTEAATLLGFECRFHCGYHVNEFDFYIEIDRPDAEGYGEIVLTTVNRRVMPLIRYRTGDVACWLPGSCPCGLALRRISPLKGRVDEQISCAWGNVHPDFFERVLRSVPGIGDEWQVALREKETKQTFQFRLELENGAGRPDEIERQILDAIQREHPAAWQSCVQKLSGVEFVFSPKGTLRKGRKLMRLVDERIANGE